MWIADHSPWSNSLPIRAIGWLDNEHPYPTGPIDIAIYNKLTELFTKHHGFFFTLGTHNCNLCQFEGETDKGELFVPGNGFLYVCPKLILHYIHVHWYQPPDEFCQAVLTCPPIDTMEYRKLFLHNGGREFMKQLKEFANEKAARNTTIYGNPDGI